MWEKGGVDLCKANQVHTYNCLFVGLGCSSKQNCATSYEKIGDDFGSLHDGQVCLCQYNGSDWEDDIELEAR